ncbi:MAG: hypothetical protein R6U15_06635 [Candidatus Izemoplasmatales bacterium]
MYIIETINKNPVGCIQTLDIGLQNDEFKKKVYQALIEYFDANDVKLDEKSFAEDENGYVLEAIIDNKRYRFSILKIKVY